MSGALLGLMVSGILFSLAAGIALLLYSIFGDEQL